MPPHTVCTPGTGEFLARCATISALRTVKPSLCKMRLPQGLRQGMPDVKSLWSECKTGDAWVGEAVKCPEAIALKQEPPRRIRETSILSAVGISSLQVGEDAN